jgi:hypothetical protein
MLKNSSTGAYLFLSDGLNSYSYQNSLGSYNLLATFSGMESVSASDDVTYMWQGLTSVGHMVICNNNNNQAITYNPIQPLYTQVSVAANGLTILAYGLATMTIDFYYTCTNFAYCATCNTIVCFTCQYPYSIIGAVCDMCLVTNCQTCSTITQCLTCRLTFTLSASFSCTCATGTTLSLISNQCVSCKSSYCGQCDFTDVCAVCKTTFTLTTGVCSCPAAKKLSTVSTCVYCSIFGCSKCSSDNVCAACLSTFALSAGICNCPINTTLSSDGSSCATCMISFCNRCDTNNVCSSCNSSFTLVGGACLCTNEKTFNTSSLMCETIGIPPSSNSDDKSATTVYTLASIVALFGASLLGVLVYAKSLAQAQNPP